MKKCFLVMLAFSVSFAPGICQNDKPVTTQSATPLLTDLDGFQLDPSFVAMESNINSPPPGSDLSTLHNDLSEIQKEFGSRGDRTAFYVLELDVSFLATSSAFGSSPDLLRQQFSAELSSQIAQGSDVPLDISFRALRFLMERESSLREDGGVNQTNFAASRLRDAISWLSTFRRLSDVMDSNFDPSTPVYIDDVDIVPGSDPKWNSIMTRRKQNFDNLQREHDTQRKLYDLNTRIVPQMCSALINSYSLAPTNRAELTGLLNEYGLNKVVQNNILSQVPSQ